MLQLAVAGMPAAGPSATPVPADPGALQQALAAAAPGDTLELAAGTHAGPVRVTVPGLVLLGAPGAWIDGGGEGSVVTVAAPRVTVAGLGIRGSGARLDRMDAGVFLGREATAARVLRNRLDGNLFGVYVWGAAEALVQGNRIRGRVDLRMSERGNGVSVWNAPGAVIADNRIHGGRDGIFTETSSNNVFRGNRMEALRFAIHYMYTNDSTVSDNTSIGNHVGYALMYSSRLEVHGNVSRGDRDHGIALNYANDSRISGNRVRDGANKCVFIYNANYNRFEDNIFRGCAIGVHFTAGSEHNVMTGNAFIDNRSQVKYVGTRHLDWAEDGRGNYWSDHSAFDLDGDGRADTAYRPNDFVDGLLWRYPSARLLLSSPAVHVLRWAQSQLPSLYPGGVRDSAPLMRVPGAAAADDGQ